MFCLSLRVPSPSLSSSRSSLREAAEDPHDGYGRKKSKNSSWRHRAPDAIPQVISEVAKPEPVVFCRKKHGCPMRRD